MSWKSVQLSDVCELINGRAYSQSEFLESGKYPVLRVGNFFTNKNWYYSDLELEDRKYCNFGDLLYAWSASFGPRFWQGDKSIFHYHIWKVEVNPDLIDKRFLYHFFEWDVENIKKESGTGSTMIHVSKKSMDARIINLPPLPIQQKIVAKLDAIFAEIDKATAAAEANAKNAEALFQSYLTQVFEREGKEWKRIKVAELGKVQSGGTPSISKKDYWGDDVEWFSSGELNSLYTLSSIRRVTFSGIKNSNAKIFPENSLLIGMYDTAAMKMSLLRKPAAFNQAIVGIEPSEKINMIFLYYALTFIKPYVLSLRRGVRQKNLSLAKIKDLSIQFPKLEVQTEVSNRLNFFKETSQKLSNNYLDKIKEYTKIKNSILKQAFNGELVKD